jgi:dephospho-CoA kinase
LTGSHDTAREHAPDRAKDGAMENSRFVSVEFRPAWSVTLLAYSKWLVLGVGLMVASLVLRAQHLWAAAHICALAGAALAAAALAGGFLMRARVRYGLSPEFAWAKVGLLGSREVRVPRESVQHATCVRSALARVLNTGDVAVWTAGGSSAAMVFRWVEDPDRVMREVQSKPIAHQQSATARDERSSFLVIGLVGAIAAGKSEVAKVLAERGCVVIDADKLAKAALLRSDVKAQLTQWWGSDVLDSSGEIDKKKLASVIFSDAAKREQLESLVHPIVHADRAAAITSAREAGKPGVVIDAPLLFEAGSEKFCDRVLCVDAPREQRLHRVQVSRGWDDAELTRREAAQLSIEEKRKRADVTIDNNASREELRRAVLEVWNRWRTSA